MCEENDSHPQVPVYVYTYTPKPTHFLKIQPYVEKIEPDRVQDGYYHICCAIGRKHDYYREPKLLKFVELAVEEAEVAFYISTSLASNILLLACTHASSPYYNWYKTVGIPKAIQLANEYQRQFDTYVEKKRAIHCIQKVYLENYYNPSRPFCQARLVRDVRRLNSVQTAE